MGASFLPFLGVSSLEHVPLDGQYSPGEGEDSPVSMVCTWERWNPLMSIDPNGLETLATEKGQEVTVAWRRRLSGHVAGCRRRLSLRKGLGFCSCI